MRKGDRRADGEPEDGPDGSRTFPDASRAIGRREDVDPIDHMVGAWAGQPASAATAMIEGNDGTIPHAVTDRNVPVDAFWSVTVQDAGGHLEPNALGRNSCNDFTAAPNEDGSITLNFGRWEDGRINCIPITPGWNYTIRLHEPRQEIIDGSWTFPALQPADGGTPLPARTIPRPLAVAPHDSRGPGVPSPIDPRRSGRAGPARGRRASHAVQGRPVPIPNRW